MTPTEELIKKMKQVDWDAPHLEPHPFRLNGTLPKAREVITELWLLHDTRSNAIVTWMT